MKKWNEEGKEKDEIILSSQKAAAVAADLRNRSFKRISPVNRLLSNCDRYIKVLENTQKLWRS